MNISTGSAIPDDRKEMSLNTSWHLHSNVILLNALSGVVLFLIWAFLGEMEEMFSTLFSQQPVLRICTEGYEEGDRHSEKAHSA